MIEQNAKRGWRQGGLLGWIIVLMCLCVAAALVHANLSDHLAGPAEYDDESTWVVPVGWPFIHGEYGYGLPAERHWPRFEWLAANVLICAVLLASTAATLVSWLRPWRSVWQFTLSDMFVAVTAVGIVIFLLIWDGDVGAIRFHPMLRNAGDYSTLARLPAYDQVVIWFGVFCFVQVILKLLLRVLLSRTTGNA